MEDSLQNGRVGCRNSGNNYGRILLWRTGRYSLHLYHLRCGDATRFVARIYRTQNESSSGLHNLEMTDSFQVGARPNPSINTDAGDKAAGAGYVKR